MGVKRKAMLFLIPGLLFLIQARGICWSQTTERVSVDSAGGNSDNGSNAPSISSDGRYVAFQSAATDLVPAGSNGLVQIFFHDRQTGTTTQVSVNSGGQEGDSPSSAPSISGNGWHVAYESWATNLAGIGDGIFPDIFVLNRQTGDIIRVSVEDSAGAEGGGPSFHPSISADGRYVAFDSDSDLVATDSGLYYDIFVHDRDADENGTYDEDAPVGISTTRVSVDAGGNESNGHSYSPAISGDGRYVAFESFATDLVAGGTNGNSHIFVRDRQTGTTTLVSVHSNGTEGDQDSTLPSISADGRYVAFQSQADNLIDGDANLFPLSDIFVHDILTGTTTLVSVDSNGIQGNGDSTLASISADGRYVAFKSQADNLVVGDTNLSPLSDTFVHDLLTGITALVSVDSNGIQGNGDSSAPSISSDGKFVAFESEAKLVTDDNGLFSDIFVYERESLPPTVDSTSPANNSNGVAVGSSISATFSEPMNGSTIDTNTFTLDNGVTGTVTYDANTNTATFNPSSKLDYATTYSATITTAARDLADNPMLADFTWTFTTKSEQKNSGGSGSCFISTAASDWEHN
ncbi:MAG: Ig-like domain-containing protein [Deltaproteobacteria bacterium]|nr:Ig-like domain-containing protein [Deltaproteobacteria bacterium]